jgi:predicted RNA binding protein YcfA (HicA-like mRNA interferase family)
LPPKVRNLLEDLKKAGFSEVESAGKGSHRKWVHQDFPGAVTISGKLNEDAKQYQIRQVGRAIERVKK